MLNQLLTAARQLQEEGATHTTKPTAADRRKAKGMIGGAAIDRGGATHTHNARTLARTHNYKHQLPLPHSADEGRFRPVGARPGFVSAT